MAGDRALRNLGTLLSRYTANGIACRLGGDEFLLFLPDISAEKCVETNDTAFSTTSIPSQKLILKSKMLLCLPVCICALPAIPLQTVIPKQIRHYTM